MLDAVPLVEPAVVPEIHVDGIASVDRVGDTIKLAYFTVMRSIASEGLERVICLRITVNAKAALRMEMEYSTPRRNAAGGESFEQTVAPPPH